MSNKHSIFVDFHVIQTVPPSCVNRDDTGSPKTAIFGGVTRARVSSQCWKHAMRSMFVEEFPSESVGVRTKHVCDLLAGAILKLNPECDSEKVAKSVLEKAGVKTKDNKGKMETGALFFISRKQIDALAQLAVTHMNDDADKKECKNALMANPAIDIALFGRMVADDPSLNFDAAAQVAHAISTHAVHNEYDYFTAVDDCASADNSGAGHLGTVEYNSSTLYRYATVNVTELAKALREDTAKAVRGFADAFIRSMPTGKQNTFANRTLPNAVYVAVRKDQPINMAAAFESPVSAGQCGYAQASVDALVKYAEETYRNYLPVPELTLTVGAALSKLSDPTSLSNLLDQLEVWTNEHLNEVI